MQAGLHFLDSSNQTRLQRLVAAQGLNATAKALGISRGVVSAALGGTGVRRGSLELLVQALSRKDATK